MDGSSEFWGFSGSSVGMSKTNSETSKAVTRRAGIVSLGTLASRMLEVRRDPSEGRVATESPQNLLQDHSGQHQVLIVLDESDELLRRAGLRGGVPAQREGPDRGVDEHPHRALRRAL